MQKTPHFICVNSSFAIIYMGEIELVALAFAFCHLVSRDCYVALPHGDTGLSAVYDCDIFLDHTHLLFLATLGHAFCTPGNDLTN